MNVYLVLEVHFTILHSSEIQRMQKWIRKACTPVTSVFNCGHSIFNTYIILTNDICDNRFNSFLLLIRSNKSFKSCKHQNILFKFTFALLPYKIKQNVNFRFEISYLNMLQLANHTVLFTSYINSNTVQIIHYNTMESILYLETKIIYQILD